MTNQDALYSSMNKIDYDIFFIQEATGYEITLSLGQWKLMCVDEFIHHNPHHHIVGPMRADIHVDEFQLSWRAMR
jgi:hypothetical protein